MSVDFSDTVVEWMVIKVQGIRVDLSFEFTLFLSVELDMPWKRVGHFFYSTYQNWNTLLNPMCSHTLMENMLDGIL